MSGTGSPKHAPSGFVQDDGFVDIYANNLRLSVTIFDMAITFSVQDSRSTSINLLKDLATVRLSPGSVKALQKHLASAVSAYEEVCGTIPTSDSAGRGAARMEALMKDALRKQLAATSNEF